MVFIILCIPIAAIYYLSKGDIGPAILFGLLSIPLCRFLFGGHSDTKKMKTRTDTVNGIPVKMVLMKYIGYETYTTAFGNKKRRRVWKTKWVTEEQYKNKKYRPYVTRPWESRFFD